MCEEEVTGTLPLLRRMLLTSNTCRYSQTQLHDGETGEVEGVGRLWGMGVRVERTVLGMVSLHQILWG